MAYAKALNLNRPRSVKQQQKDDRYLDPTGGSLAMS
jgi:hypothetical protein